LIEVATVGKRFVAVLAVSMGLLSGGSSALAGVNAASALPAAPVAAAPKPFKGELPRMIEPSAPPSGETAEKVAPPLPIIPVTAPAAPSPTYPEIAPPTTIATPVPSTVPPTRPAFDPAKSVEAQELRTATRTVFKIIAELLDARSKLQLAVEQTGTVAVALVSNLPAAYFNLANVLAALAAHGVGHIEDALAPASKAYELDRDRFGDGHPETETDLALVRTLQHVAAVESTAD
jgi:hypothetical protein